MLPRFFDLILNFVSVVLGVGDTGGFPPPLPQKEERALLEEMRGGSREARSKLIEHNLRLVAHIVRKYYGSSGDPDELVSIGTLGLIKAIDSFRPEYGARFATYAARCIQNEILMHFRASRKLSQEVSINETIDIDRDGNPLTYLDIIASDDTIAEDLDTRIYAERACRILSGRLDLREREILILRYGLNGKAPLTQREVARKLGISRSYVSRIEKKALLTMRRELESGNFIT